MLDNGVSQHYPLPREASQNALQVVQRLYVAGEKGAHNQRKLGGPHMHMFRSATEITPTLRRDIIPLSAVYIGYRWSCDLAVNGAHSTWLCNMCWTLDRNGQLHTRDHLLAPDQPVQTWWTGEAQPLTHAVEFDATVQSTPDQSEALASDIQ